MINEHDSSAPNSHEITRLSGEQAEERTARDIRKLSEQAAEAILNDGGFGLRGGQYKYCPSQAAETIAKIFEPECSRLASRLENEKVAHKMCDDMAHDAYKAIAPLTGMPFDGHLYDFDALVDSVKRVLAGSHTEEKE